MTNELDEDFRYFLEDEGFGPAIYSTPVPDKALQRYSGRLPGQLLKYWADFGWAAYGGGLFWTVDPDEYEPALEAWLGDTDFVEKDALHVIARTAFGQLFVWGERSGQCMDVRPLWGMIFPTDDSARVSQGGADRLVRYFFSGLEKSALDQKDRLESPLFDRAVKKLGPLAADEMYAFEPALALGGSADLKNLRKVKCVEHLVMLAQLGERQIMRDIVKDAKSAGLL